MHRTDSSWRLDAADVFICGDCDKQLDHGDSNKRLDHGDSNRHTRTHAVVRCTVPAITRTEQWPDGIEKRFLELMEKQAAAHRTQIAALNERIARLENLPKAPAPAGEGNSTGKHRTPVSGNILVHSASSSLNLDI